MKAREHLLIEKEAEKLAVIVADVPSFFNYNLDEAFRGYIKEIEKATERMKEIAYPNGYCPECEGEGCYDCQC